MLGGVDGILVPGGFGYRGIEGKIEAIRYAREREVPFFGICLGLQCAVIEFARNVARPGGRQQHRVRPQLPPSRSSACSTSSTPSPTRAARCGWARIRASWPRAAGRTRPTAALLVHERHRHRYEFNNQYRQQFAAHGLVVTGTSPDGKLVEVIELRDHPWFVAVQCHPEFKSKPTEGASAVPRLRPGEPGAARRKKAKERAVGQRGRCRIVKTVQGYQAAQDEPVTLFGQ